MSQKITAMKLFWSIQKNKTTLLLGSHEKVEAVTTQLFREKKGNQVEAHQRLVASAIM